MKRSIFETALGALVILIAVVFLIYGLSKTQSPAAMDGMTITADFSNIGGLKPGDAVQISGVKVGTVSRVDLDPSRYLAQVSMTIPDDIKLPTDTTAIISSESLLGGRYLALEPGGEEEIIPAGGKIKYTQAPQNLEELLGKFIFSVQDSKKNASDDTAAAAPAAATAPIEDETETAAPSAAPAPEATTAAEPEKTAPASP